MDRKPDFFVIGAAKSGTTTLVRLLQQHPHLAFADPKEPSFFSHDDNYSKGWEWYGTSFRNTGQSTLVIGEGSTDYSMRTLYPNTAPRIAEHLPDSKFIYIVRHPLGRIVSMWRMMERLGRGRDPKISTFNNDVQKEGLMSCLLIDASRYWFQINAFRDWFSDSQIHVAFFEDLIADQRTVCAECFKFLGLEPLEQLEEVHENLGVQRVERDALLFVRKLLGASTLIRVMPVFVKERLKRSILFSKRSERADWTEESLRWTIRQLGDDPREFLSFYNKPPDFWKLDV